MSQADIAYAASATDLAGLPRTLTIFADRAQLRSEMRDDVEAFGLRVRLSADVAGLLEGEARPLGEIVLLDCPEIDGSKLAALMRLDMWAAHCGAQLVVSATVEALEDVFGCLDQSAPQILINPTRAERIIAVGHALARATGSRVRELAEEDRLLLLRLTEQVCQIAERLDRLSRPVAGLEQTLGSDSAFRFEAPRSGFASAADEGDRLVRAARPPLPDPRLVRRVMRQRQLRARFFDSELFADPAWDMLLDLTAARAEHQRVSVTSLCIASGVPPTTALRWIGQMTDAGLLQRVEDETDRRRAFMTLTDKAADAMARFFAELGSSAARMV